MCTTFAVNVSLCARFTPAGNKKSTLKNPILDTFPDTYLLLR